MKYLLLLLSVMLLLTGCTYKNEALNLASYNAQYAGPLAKEKPTVLLRLVKDIRADKQSVGYLLDNGKTLATLYTNADIEAKYQEGLGYALNLAGFNTDASLKAASMVVEVYIKDIEMVYNDKNFDTNLRGEIEIEVIVRRGADVITQNFRQKGAKWIAPSFESKDLEPFLYTLFADSIDQIVSRLTRL